MLLGIVNPMIGELGRQCGQYSGNLVDEPKLLGGMNNGNICRFRCAIWSGARC